MNRATHEMLNRLERLGISYDDACALRRISMTLQRWHELECGTGDGQITISVERDDDDGPPFRRIQYPTAQGYVDRRYRIPDREKGAKKRLAAIMAKYESLSAYVQTDPRGAALYIMRLDDVPKGEEVHAYYTRGVAVYK